MPSWGGPIRLYLKSANKFDDQESLPVLDNHILAIIKNPEEAKVIVETLNGSGFSPDDIGLLRGGSRR